MMKCSLDYIECRIADWLWKIFPVILLVIGTGGNALNITILSRGTLRGYSTSVYLMVLAVSDTLALWSVLPESTYTVLLDQKYLSLSDLHCKFTSWVAYSSCAVSAWTVVNLTIERVLLTLYPMKAKARLTPKVSLVVSLVTVLIIQLFTTHVIFGHAMHEKLVVDSRTNTSSSNANTSMSIKVFIKECSLISQDYRDFFKTTWSYIVLICFNLLPICAIITGNVIIGYVLFQRKRKVFPNLNTNQLNMRRERLAIKMLLVISGIFIVCTSPYCVYYVARAYTKDVKTLKEEAVDALVHAIVNILLFCNFTFNFALYFARGRLFRQEWTKLMASCKRTVSLRHNRRTRPIITETRTQNTYV